MVYIKSQTSTMIFFIIFFLWGLPLADADDIVVRAHVSQSRIAVHDTVTLSLSINAVQEVEQPEPPRSLADRFDVLSQGSTSNLQLANGQFKAETVFEYLLSPKREGSLEIEPFSVGVGGKAYYSNAITVIVGDASQGARPALPPPALSPNGESLGKEPYFVTVELDDESAFVNQQILYTFRFYTRQNVSEARLGLPDFADFFKEEVVPENKFYTQIRGERYVVTEKVFALFPSKTGTLTIDPAELRISLPRGADDRSFFGSRLFGLHMLQDEVKVLKSKPMTVGVVPLPEPEPENFSNLLGTFALGMTVDRETMKVGESAAVSVELRGVGNVTDAVLPAWTWPEGLKVYEDRPQSEISKTAQGIQGVKRFKWALVPTQSGTVTLRPFTMSYLNPETARYEQLSTEAFTLAVEANGTASPTALLPSGREEGPGEGKGLSGMREGVSVPLGGWGFVYGMPRSVLYVVWALPPFVFLGFLGLGQIRRYRRAHYRDYRRERALKDAKKALRPFLKKKEVALADVEKVLKIVRHYFGIKQGLERGVALNSGDIHAALGRTRLSAEEQSSFMGAVQDLEAFLYGEITVSDRVFSRALKSIWHGLEKIHDQL